MTWRTSELSRMGLKPAGRILLRNEQDRRMFDEALAELGLRAKPLGNKRLFWRDERRIGDMFDLDALLRDYRTWNDIAVSLRLDAADIRSIESEISSWASDTLQSLPATLPEIAPASSGEIALQGLLLGYPVAATADPAYRQS